MLIAQTNIQMDAGGNYCRRRNARQEGDFPVIEPSKVDYTDVAPNQIASISASLIPFLEHDDANRA
jgi:DNA-directed RNA polymerase subunit beta